MSTKSNKTHGFCRVRASSPHLSQLPNYPSAGVAQDDGVPGDQPEKRVFLKSYSAGDKKNKKIKKSTA